jgi:1,4-alpha-glucan branching enzyme
MQRACGVRRQIAVIAWMILSAACADRLREGVTLSPAGVRFQVRLPDAASVAVAGDFNGWSVTSDPMTRSGELWVRQMVLPPGEYAFMYVVDESSWITPPNAAEVVSDGFGGFNGKVVVP